MKMNKCMNARMWPGCDLPSFFLRERDGLFVGEDG